MSSNTMKRIVVAVVLQTLCASSLAQANPAGSKPWGAPKNWWKSYVRLPANKDGSLPEECVRALEGKPPMDLSRSQSATEIMPSGRDAKELPRNIEASDLVDKAADLLGIVRPPKHIEFVPSAELALLASLGRPALGHWHDGSILAKNAVQAMGVMEFVTPGCPTCRSFFTDGVTPDHQIEIFKHVLGHDSFSYSSMYCQIRQPCDPIAAAEHMYKFMEDAYQRYDADEVSQWYQYLLTLGSAQDYARGSFMPPEAFEKQPFLGSFVSHPSAPTPHELQFTVTNLPESVPAWKKEMVRLFEEMERVKGYIIQTKIINEGWAFFMQDFLAPYLPYNDDHHVIESAILKSAVGPASLSNPYWLGREGWRNLHKRFNSRVYIRDLDQLAKDRAFVKYAETIRQQYNDYDFLRLALDEEWIRKQGLYLYRKAGQGEWDPSLPRPQRPDLNEQKVVVSTDAKDVVAVIATRVADRSRQMPRILLEAESATARNVFSLAHEVVGDIPLDRRTIGPSMYVRSRIWGRAISLKTIASSSWGTASQAQNRSMAIAGFWGPSEPTPLSTRPIRVEVQPDGHAQVFHFSADGTEILDAALTKTVQQTVDAYRADEEGIVHAGLEEAQDKRFSNFVTAMADSATRPAMNLLSHAPSSATAILRYYEMLERRMHNAVMRAVQGKTGSKRVRNGMRIKVLPDIPEFALDRSVIQQLDDQAPAPGQNLQQAPSRIPRTLLELVAQNQDTEFQFSPALRVGGGASALDVGGDGRTPRKGDRFWGKGKDSGDGEGDGDGDGDSDGDGDGDKPGKPKKPGKGEGNSTEIDIPLDLWGEFLREEIELPHLRPKGGQTDITETERDGARQHSRGEILWNRVMPRALTLGRLALKKKGIDPSKVSPQKLMKEGLRYIQPSDWKVHDSAPVPLPDVNAVVVIWMDMTGSMMGKPIEMAKQFMFNLKTLLGTKYKNVTFRYVGFTTVAKEYETETSFFRDFLNGGTDYNCGIEKTREILAEYNPSQWDKFTFGIGDAEDGNGATSSQSLREMAQETQYSAFIQTQIGWNSPDPTFMGTVKELAASDEFFGHAELTPAEESGISVLKQILGKDRKK